ncbi:RES family NAD+ phosphorylase [uncultured Hoeflea sp.]|uniref:RES family NAD+ phosphorylase n=1 Tax=uncultured Hoeflea sp. TaxID=538666 RepID=UPI0026362080|nr:RES family NAD+ phosphorylase [uncultured Hoeflea sp.]
MRQNKHGMWIEASYGPPPIKALAVREQRQIVKSLDRLDLRRDDAYISLTGLGILHQGLPTRTIGMNIDQSLFRVRTNAPKKVETIADLSSPPAEYVKGYQRCNAPQEPMFYGSDEPSTALMESRVKAGQEVYLCEWRCNGQIPVNHTMVPRLSDPKAVVSKNEKFLVDYLRKKFSERIVDDFSHKYKITAFMAKLLTTQMPKSERLNIADDGLIGIVYPSVRDQKKRLNVALHPALVERSLNAVNVIQATITSVSARGYRLRVEDVSKSIEGHTIIWSGETGSLPPRWPAERSSTVIGEYEV